MPAMTVTIGQPFGAGEGTIHAPEMSDEELASLGEVIREHMVTVSPEAPSCCIDGRGCSECMDGSAPEPRPAVAGGALTTAYVAAELIGWFGPNDTRPTADKLQNVHNQLAVGGIKPGNHVDRNAVNAGFDGNKTGCGADDKAPLNVRQVYKNKPVVNGTTQLLLGDSYKETAMQFTDSQAVETRFADWNPVALLEVLTSDSKKNVEILEDMHDEGLVVINNVPDTTFDRDGFLAATGRRAFKIDVWYIDKMARAMASGPEASTQYEQLRHAMVAYQVGTYLTLCDGSQRPAFVRAS
jgi:hypothetical protein